MMWYKALVVAALCAMDGICGWTTAPVLFTGENQPSDMVRVIEIEPDFRGAVPVGSIVRRTVMLENLSDAALSVQVTAVSCPSLDVLPKRATLDPRETIEISLSALAADVGSQQWYTADLEVRRIGGEANIEGTVQRVQLAIGYTVDAVGFASPRLLYMVVPAWQTEDTRVWVQRRDGKSIGSVVASSPGGWLRYGGFEPNRDRPFEGALTLRAAPGPPAIHYGVVKIRDVTGTHFNDVFVSVRVVPSLRADPPGLVLVPGPDGQLAVRMRSVHLMSDLEGVEPARATIGAASHHTPVSAQLSRTNGEQVSWKLNLTFADHDMREHGTVLVDVLDDQERVLVTVPVVWFARPVGELVAEALAK